MSNMSTSSIKLQAPTKAEDKDELVKGIKSSSRKTLINFLMIDVYDIKSASLKT